MNNDNQFEGLDFQPSLKTKKKTVSFTVSEESKEYLEYLQRRYHTNMSAFFDELILTVKKVSGVLEPMDYPLEKGKYKEVTLLLRRELAEFIEAWKTYGKVGNMCITSTLTQPSTPIQIARKMSYLLAENPEFMSCDSNIYGVREHTIEERFKRAGEKAKELPETKFHYKEKPLPQEQ